jgi:hypothetical protein
MKTLGDKRRKELELMDKFIKEHGVCVLPPMAGEVDGDDSEEFVQDRRIHNDVWDEVYCSNSEFYIYHAGWRKRRLAGCL